MHALRAEAEALRSQGYSYALIQEKLGISRSTLHYWFRDKPFIPNEEVLGRIKAGPEKAGMLRRLQRLEDTARLKQEGVEEVGELTDRDIFMLGLGFYLGEGAKTTEAIRIVNSDPMAIRLAIRWLKQACHLNEDNLTVSLHLYPDNDVSACKAYWQKVTSLPAENFRWISVDAREGKRKDHSGRLPFGTAHITVRANGDREKGVRLFRRISGWLDGVLNQV